MALMEITVVPIGTSTTSIGDYIAEIEKELDQEEVGHKLTDMGTIIEGESDKLFVIAAKLHKVPFRKGIQRVLTTITIDDRRDKEVKLGNKIASVEARLR